ncbi:MAG: Na(+)/H(+) antiporter subunit D [Gemmatimonadota bacterium]|nr:Na(+)/H(+) antiporter subunit D [Gemmatimonadota bacterium]
MTVSFPPGLILIAGALLIPAVRGTARNAVVMALPLLTLAAVWMIPEGHSVAMPFLDYELLPVHWTRTGRVFATVFAITAFVGGIYAMGQARALELAAAFAYAGSAVGVTLAGDLVTMLVFWELMAVGSTVVLWASDQPGAYAASMRYLLVHLFGGVVLMFGVVAHIGATGSVAFEPMRPDNLATAMILVGFLVNAGAPPLSAWIADAYPEASPSGMVFLSAFTTKTAVFALLMGFPGTQILIWIGLYMALYGIVYAVLENDVRRILAYSIVNQVGFMVTAIGVGSELALNGAVAHAFGHIVYKALLLMSAGSVLYMTGKRKATELGGLFRTMPQTAIAGIIGALSISAFPFTSGFISKLMIKDATADAHLAVAWFVLAAASAAAPLYVGLKFPWVTFFQKDSGLRPSEPPRTMLWPMWIFSVLCVGIGVVPGLLYGILPYPVDYHPYSASHVLGQLQLLFLGALAFFLLLPAMKWRPTISLDWDWFYRRFGTAAARELALLVGTARNRFTGAVVQQVRSVIARLSRIHGPLGPLARSWPTGSMVLWVAILLLASLVVYL